MKHYHRCWAEVDLSALRENLAWIRHRVGPSMKIMTVVKSDAYGHGLKQIAALLMQSGTDIFGVANLVEAQAIRGVGQGWPIVMLGASLPGEVEQAVRDDVMPTISSLEEARLFSVAATRLRKTVAAHVKIDTGMGRLGVAPRQARELIREIGTLPGIQVHGLCSHYASVEDDVVFSRRQRARFQRVVTAWLKAGIRLRYLHLNNSGAILFERAGTFNTVRPGLLVYGVLPPSRRPVPAVLQERLRPALTWKCRVSLVKDLSRGAPVSYGRTFVAPKNIRVAIVTAGYGDGYLRAGSNQARVLIGGIRCPVLGGITMDQMIVDVSRAPHVRAGDEVALIGRQDAERITANEVAAWCGTIPWEVLTSITYRVPRLYQGGSAA